MAEAGHDLLINKLFGLLRESRWLWLVAGAVYITAALYGYDTADSAWSHSTGSTQIHNPMGVLGAHLSDLMFYLFGVSSWWLVLFMLQQVWAGYRSLRADSLFCRRTLWVSVAGFALLLLSSSALEAIRLHTLKIPLPTAPGGMFGMLIGDTLSHWLGFTGATLLLLTLMATSFSVFSGLSWLRLVDWLGVHLELAFCRVKLFFQTRKDKSIGEQTMTVRSIAIEVEKRRVEEHQPIHIASDPADSMAAQRAMPVDLPQESMLPAELPDAGMPAAHIEMARPVATPVHEPTRVMHAAPVPRAVLAAIETARPAFVGAPVDINEPARTDKPVPAPMQIAPVTPPLTDAPDIEVLQPTRMDEVTALNIKVEPFTRTDPVTPVCEPVSLVHEPVHETVHETVHEPVPVVNFHPVQAVIPAIERVRPIPASEDRGGHHFTEMPEAVLPPLELLDPAIQHVEVVSADLLESTSRLIERKLQDFGVAVKVVGAYPGPVITRYEIEPAVGVKGSQITNLVRDLARALSVASIRLVETIPGKAYMALELPNEQRQTVQLSEILSSQEYAGMHSALTIAMGKDISGKPVVADLARMPHVLVAGTTGSGKSVAINAMILSLLYKATPQQVRLLLIDPKMLELSVYEGIPHLLCPVVTDMRQAASGLNWCVQEMDKRYRLMSALGVRNIAGYNQKLYEAIHAGQPRTNPFSLTPDDPEALEELPLIVVCIDELADLMMVVGKKVEELIARLAQKARASGIHLVLATQRPSVDVITGLIKANVPTRVAFQVSSKIDSRTILGQMGAEALLGQGDMLYLPPGTGYPQRVHGAFVSDQEVHRVAEYLKAQGAPQYIEGVLSSQEDSGDEGGGGPTLDAEADPLYDQAVDIVVRSRRASISQVQRNLRIGYNRAARLVEQMEAAGIVSAMQSNGNREVLAPENRE